MTLTLAVTGCAGSQKKEASNRQDNKLQVLYFHGKQRCVTCRAIEDLTKEVVEKDYTDAFKNGAIQFTAIDFSEPEGEAIADRYEVAWSSLLLVKGDKVFDMTDAGFSMAKSHPEAFKSKLKEQIEKML